MTVPGPDSHDRHRKQNAHRTVAPEANVHIYVYKTVADIDYTETEDYKMRMKTGGP